MGATNEVINRELNAVSRISAGMTVIKGEVTTTHDLRIDGAFEGKISSKARLIVGEGATLKADVICQSLELYGTFEGSAIVGDTLSLKPTSDAKGSFSVNKLLVEVGARFNAETKMISEEDFKKAIVDDPFYKAVASPNPDQPQPLGYRPPVVNAR